MQQAAVAEFVSQADAEARDCLDRHSYLADLHEGLRAAMCMNGMEPVAAIDRADELIEAIVSEMLRGAAAAGSLPSRCPDMSSHR